MSRLTKKQRQKQFLNAFLRRTREASPGERVYWAVGDLFQPAEVHDLGREREARLDAKGPSQKLVKRGGV